MINGIYINQLSSANVGLWIINNNMLLQDIYYILYLKIDANGGASTNLFSMLIFKLSNFEQLFVPLRCNHLVRKGVDVNEH